jgi:hypothetical protein
MKLTVRKLLDRNAKDRLTREVRVFAVKDRRK